jgi:hypothetical protein
MVERLVNNELESVEGNGCGLVLGIHSAIYLDGQKNMKNHSQHRQCPMWVSSGAPPICKSKALPL